MGTTHVWKFDPCTCFGTTQQQQAPHNNTFEVMTTTELTDNSRWMILAWHTCATLAPSGPTLWLHCVYSSSAALPVWSYTTDLAMYSHPCQEYPQPRKRAKNSRLDMNTRYRACSYTHWPAKHHHPTVLTKNQKTSQEPCLTTSTSRQYATTILETRRQMLLHCHTNFCSQHVAQ